MLLTITYEGHNTQELGFLLHKHPDRAQKFELSYGKAYVFYPEVSDERTTAALLLDIDPLNLARGKVGSSGMIFFVKRYTDDSIILAGCGGDEYGYYRDGPFIERII